MVLTLETLQATLARATEQREEYWAKVNQTIGAEIALKQLIAEMEREDPKPEPPSPAPPTPKVRRKRTRKE